MIRTISIVYLIVLGLIATWAIYVDLIFLHSVREHLLPGFVLGFVTLPLSLSLSFVYEIWPVLFSKPFTQEAWFIICGMSQAAVLFLAGRRLSKGKSS